MTGDTQNTRIESRAEYDIPSKQGVNLETMPILAEKGWISIEADRQKSEVGTLYLTLSETNQFDQPVNFSVRVGRNPSLKELDRGDDQHIRNRNEDGENQNAVTYAAGDFYLDWRRDNDIRCEGGNDQIRVRMQPNVPVQPTIIATADKIREYQGNEDGSIELGREYANRSVTIAIIDATS